MQFEVKDYRKESVAEGFKFTTLVFDKVDEAIERLGIGAVLDILNSDTANTLGLAARKRAGFHTIAAAQPSEKAKVKAELSAKLAASYPDGVIFNEEDAVSWKPPIRELSLMSLGKKLNEAYNRGLDGVEDFNRILEQLKAAQAEQLARAAAQA